MTQGELFEIQRTQGAGRHYPRLFIERTITTRSSVPLSSYPLEMTPETAREDELQLEPAEHCEAMVSDLQYLPEDKIDIGIKVTIITGPETDPKLVKLPVKRERGESGGPCSVCGDDTVWYESPSGAMTGWNHKGTPDPMHRATPVPDSAPELQDALQVEPKQAPDFDLADSKASSLVAALQQEIDRAKHFGLGEPILDVMWEGEPYSITYVGFVEGGRRGTGNIAIRLDG